ncbi:hypothetical protein L9F63_017061, partial [Diploptera punctata]
AEEWVRFSNNPDLRVEEAHLYAKRGRVMCHRHFVSSQFTTPKRLRLNRGAIPTILNSSDEVYDAPEQGVSSPHNFCTKDSPSRDDVGLEGYDSCENDAEEADSRIKNESLIPEVTLTIPVKEEKEEENEGSSGIPFEYSIQQDEDKGNHPKQNGNISPT